MPFGSGGTRYSQNSLPCSEPASPRRESSITSEPTRSLHSAAQHLIQGNEIGLLRQRVGRQLLLRGIEGALCIEERQEAVCACLVPRLRNRVIALRRRHIIVIRVHLIDVRCTRRQRIRYFFERRLDRAF